MEHFDIIRSLVRLGIPLGSDPFKHQVERLIEALRSGGDTAQASALVRLVNQRERQVDLAPSRIQPSLVRRGSKKERLVDAKLVPVDKETSAPVATVVFPEDIRADLPQFDPVVRSNIAALELEWQHAHEIEDAGMRPSLSCLIYGPPGTGKTTLALWLARELGRPVVLARIDGLISSFLGTTARNLSNLFTFANRYDCVLVLDEFDAIAKIRDDPNEVGEIKRVVNALLQNLDGRARDGVTIGITNHEELLDPAIWRRFEVQLAIPLPALDQRIEIARRFLSSDNNAQDDAEARLLAWISDGLSGADIQVIAMKFRKSRLLSGFGMSAVGLLIQTAISTSSRIDMDRISALSGDGPELTAYLRSLPLGFSRSDLANLLNVSTKTISRRRGEMDQLEVSSD